MEIGEQFGISARPIRKPACSGDRLSLARRSETERNQDRRSEGRPSTARDSMVSEDSRSTATATICSSQAAGPSRLTQAVGPSDQASGPSLQFTSSSGQAANPIIEAVNPTVRGANELLQDLVAKVGPDAARKLTDHTSTTKALETHYLIGSNDVNVVGLLGADKEDGQ